MSDPVVVDATGLSCPQPVIMARRALLANPGVSVMVLVDSGTEVDNVRRLGEREGRRVDVSPVPSGGYRLVLNP
jgi:TusA-related sulfurtransferase